MATQKKKKKNEEKKNKKKKPENLQFQNQSRPFDQ